MSKTRHDGRGVADLRPISFETGVQRFPEGSVRVAFGDTRVLVAVSIEDYVRPFLAGTGKGWITAEYSMHPRANPERQRREGRGQQLGGRTQEIQRLVGRALRAAIRPEVLGERTITVDCDVLDADGGTRTASITGGWVALAIALDKFVKQGFIGVGVLREPVAAISVGLVEGRALLDLNYKEDFAAQVDLNLVATASGRIIEVQGTAEGEPMSRADHDSLLDVGLGGIEKLAALQRAAVEAAGVDLSRLVKK